MPRPRSFTPHDIATAALIVIDREGLAALSMRSVATELGVGTMSLYRYVEDRDTLERLLVDQVLAAVDVERASRMSWDKQIALITGRIRGAVGAHPSVVPLLMLHRHTSQEVARCAEAILQALTEGGFSGKERVIALRTVVSYLSGALQAQHLASLGGPGTDAMAAESPSRFPLLSATACTARGIRPDAEFREGIAVILRGLACLASTSAVRCRTT